MATLEEQLILCDCIGNAAYAYALKSAGLLTDEEYALLQEGFKELSLLASHHSLEVSGEDASVLKSVDTYLKSKFKKLGPKFISLRNPLQRYALDMRLAWRVQLLEIMELLLKLSTLNFETQAKAIKSTKKKTSSKDLAEDLKLLQNTYESINHLPLNDTVHEIDYSTLAKTLDFNGVIPTVNDNSEAVIFKSMLQILSHLSILGSKYLKVKSFTAYLESTQQMLTRFLIQVLDATEDHQSLTLQGLIDTQEAINAFYDWMSLEHEKQTVAPSQTLQKHLDWHKTKQNAWKKCYKKLLG